MTDSVFLLSELSTDTRNTNFHFQRLGKIRVFHRKTLHKHYVYENRKKNFKKIGYTKARLL